MPVIPPQIPESPYAAPASEIPPAPNPAAGELATPVIRLVAVIIDGLILLPVHLILTKLFYPTPDIAAMQAAAMRGDYQAMASMASMTGPGFVTQLLVGLLTVAALVGINWKFLPQGQTIGKKLMKIQIRSRDGSLIPVKDLITKRILPFYCAGAIPKIGPLLVIVDALCIFRPDRNTLHDDLAESKVVQL